MNLDLKKYFNSKNLLIISPLFLFIVIRYVVGFNGLYGQDSHEYYRYSRAIVDFFKTGSSPGDYFWPIYYPILGAILGLIVDNLFSLQLISFLSLSGSLFFLSKIMTSIYDEKKYFVINLAITFLFAPYVFRNSAVVMSDMLSVFFIIAAFYFFIEYLRSAKLKHIIFFSLFFSLAVLSRYAAVIVLVVPTIILLYFFLKSKNYFHLLIPALLALILVLPMILINQSKMTEMTEHAWIKGWSVSNFFMSDFVTPEGSQSNRFPNIIYSFSSIFFPTFLVFGLILVALAQRNLPKNKYLLISLIMVVVYALFLSGIPFQNQRYLLLSYPFVVIIIFPGFERLTYLFKERRILLYSVMFFMIVIQVFFCSYFFRSAIERNKLEKDIAGYINSAKHQIVYAFDIDVSFISYDVNKNYFNLWKEKYDKFQSGSLVIFNEEKFKDQWIGKNPMLNWNNLKTDYILLELKNFGDGWKVFEIGNK